MEKNSLLNSTILKQMPKIDLHRHLEGSIRIETLKCLAKEIGFDTISINKIPSKVQIQPDDPFSLDNFLSKFKYLRNFYQSKEMIQRITFECIEDAKQDNIRYLELRFSPVALSSYCSFKYCDVISWVMESIFTSALHSEIQVRPIISFNRHETIEKATEIFNESIQYKKMGLVGFDLSGDEKNYSAKPFESLFEKIKNEGFFITIHAGEWGNVENIRHAILNLHADRIGHGVRVMDNPEIVNLARKKEIPFEVCVTSNIQSGVISKFEDHPIKMMMENGLKITLNSDDPKISKICLSDEYQNLISRFGFTLSNIHSLHENAIRGSFLSQIERKELFSSFSIVYQHWLIKNFSLKKE